jgi:hypothetical protein
MIHHLDHHHPNRLIIKEANTIYINHQTLIIETLIHLKSGNIKKSIFMSYHVNHINYHHNLYIASSSLPTNSLNHIAFLS